jgi:hypothetical protein
MASEISLENEEQEAKPKGRLLYEGLLKSMPQDIVKELARRRLEEIAAYQKRQEKTNQQAQ